MVRKTRLKQKTEEIAEEMSWTRHRRGNFKKKKESERLLIAAQNNAIKTNYIKIKTDNI